MSNTSIMRHCMIVFASYPLGETRVQREAEALVKHGYDVDVICYRFPGELFIDEYKGVRIFREKCKVPIFLAKRGELVEKFLYYLCFFVFAGIRLTKLHFRKHYDTIQVHNLPDFLVFCAFIPKLLGTVIILDLHDLMPEFFAGRFGQTSSFLTRLISIQERLACRFADHVITVSEHWRQALIQRGVPSNKCSVVMNVADESIFHPPINKTAPSPSLVLQQNSFRLIYHGGMHERYGLDLVISAIDRLQQEIPNIHLILIGYGEFLPKLQDLVDKLDLGSYVTFEDSRIAEELPNLIQSCDLGVVPYRNDVFTDGLLPTKLMEYIALGKPAIASRTTAIQAYFSNTNVEFFAPGDADDLARCILMLYHNPERLAELTRGCQKFNQQYNWAKIGAEYVALIERLAKRDEPVDKNFSQQFPRENTK